MLKGVRAAKPRRAHLSSTLMAAFDPLRRATADASPLNLRNEGGLKRRKAEAQMNGC